MIDQEIKVIAAATVAVGLMVVASLFVESLSLTFAGIPIVLVIAIRFFLAAENEKRNTARAILLILAVMLVFAAASHLFSDRLSYRTETNPAQLLARASIPIEAERTKHRLCIDILQEMTQ